MKKKYLILVIPILLIFGNFCQAEIMRVYTSKAGDSFKSLANNWGVLETQVKGWNQEISGTSIRPGTTIYYRTGSDHINSKIDEIKKSESSSNFPWYLVIMILVVFISVIIYKFKAKKHQYTKDFEIDGKRYAWKLRKAENGKFISARQNSGNKKYILIAEEGDLRRSVYNHFRKNANEIIVNIENGNLMEKGGTHEKEPNDNAVDSLRAATC